MVEQAIDQKHSHDQQVESTTEGGFITISGTIFSTLGKVFLAIGTTGLLMYLFVAAEAFVGLGALYTGVTAIAGGLATMMLGNRLANGFWFDGLLSA